MALGLLALTTLSPDPAVPARFWAGLLGREVVEHDGGLLLPGTAIQVGLRFERGDVPREGSDRVHLHLTSDHAGPDGQDVVVQQVLDAGGTPLDVGQRPEEGHVVLADPDGSAFCVIEVGNSYLAGTGPLGELADDGSRDVGVFWSAALGWPLVWDQDGETAIQSPAGGTKVAWGGLPLDPRGDVPRQWYELVVDGAGDESGVAAETERLVGLGATRERDGVLADPDGNEFRLRSGS